MSAPQFVMWEHGGRVVPGKTDHIQTKHDIVTKSVLTIDKVTIDSSGMYSCMPENISPTTININIVNNTEEQLAVINISIIYQSDMFLHLTIFFLLSILNNIRIKQGINI